jgi:hypothetical protein
MTGPDVPQTEPAPVTDAYAALERGDVSALPDLIDTLDQSVASDPDDGLSLFYTGAMRLWRVVEAQKDPEPNVAQVVDDSMRAIDDLRVARDLRPNDSHPAGFFGIGQVAVGSTIRNEERVDEGEQALTHAVALDSAYIHGIRALAYGALGTDHRYFHEALDGLQGTVEACQYESGGEHALAYAYPTEDLPHDQRVCNNSGAVAHVWEGFFLTYGDVMTKLGDGAAARILYENAKASPTYDRWTLTDLLRRRIDDADARAALYSDDDPANDPRTWMEEGLMCTGCHASTP